MLCGRERAVSWMRIIAFTVTRAVVIVCLAIACADALTPSPEDWRDRVLYQIVTDRFDNGDPTNDTVEGHFDPDSSWSIHGGDFAGIVRRLDYLTSLGIGAIWISPVVVNVDASFHGYSAQNFRAVAPHFGTEAELRALADACHARGIALILDVICNHTGTLLDGHGPGWPSFRPEGGYALAYRDGRRYAPPFDSLSWYHDHGHIDYSDGATSSEEELGELFGLDDLDTDRPAVRDELISVFSWLIDATDCDGFRIDTVKHVPLGFWQEWAPAIHAHAASVGKENFLLFGETWSGSDDQVGRYTGTRAGGPFVFDSMLYYPMFYTLHDVFAAGGSPRQIADRYAGLSDYDAAARERLVTFLDNHDNARFRARAGTDAQVAAALGFLLTTRGLPIVYYGTEQGFDGANADAAREDHFDGGYESGPSLGDDFDMASPLYVHTARLASLREDWAPLRRGGWTERFAESGGAGLLVFEREHEGERVLVCVNTAGSSRTASPATGFAVGTVLRDLLEPATSVAVGEGGRTAVTVPAYGMRVFADAAAWIEPRPLVARFAPGHAKRARADAPLAIAFSQAMDRASVEAAFALDPPAAGSFAWSGDTLRFTSAGGWAAETRYAVRVDAAARAAAGRTMRGAFEAWFETAGATPPGWMSGTLTAEQSHWGAGGSVASPVRLSGDVVVPEGITLRIEPGTEVLVSEDGDDRLGGLDPDRIEIFVLGRMEVAATTSAPVVFRCDPAGPFERGLWSGIRIAGGAGSRLEGAQIWNAVTGVRAEAAFDRIGGNAVFMPMADGFAFGGGAAGPVEDNFVFDAGASGFLVEDGSIEMARNTVLIATRSGIECRGGAVSVRCGRLSFCAHSALAASSGAEVRLGPGVQVIGGADGAYRDVVNDSASPLDAAGNWWGGRRPVSDGAVRFTPPLEVPPFPSAVERSGRRLFFAARVPAFARVRVGANFNGWNPDALAMTLGDDGFWTAETAPLAAERHQYKLVLDSPWGAFWIPDPGRSDREPDGFGGFNSAVDLSSAIGARGGSLALAAESGAVTGRLAIDPAAGYVGLYLLREEVRSEPSCALPSAERVDAALLRPGASGHIDVRDDGVLPETRYRYHLHAVDASGADWALSVAEITTAPDTRLLLLPLAPNPTTGGTRIRLYVPARSRCTARLYDAAGRLVRVVLDRDEGPGYADAAWDGRDGEGREAVSGIYFLRVTAAGHEARGTITRVR